MLCRCFSRYVGIFAALAMTFALCFVGVDVSAVDTFTQWTVSDTASFYGNLPFTYEIAGTTFSSTFSYIGGSAYGHNLISAVNIESNSVLSTANTELYDVLVYVADVRYTDGAIRNISIPVDIYVSGGFRTFFGIPSSLTYSANSPNPNFTENTIADYPNNFISGGGAALPSASSPAYYNASSIRFPNNSGGGSFYGVTMRALTYDAVDGTIAQLNFDGAKCISDKLYLFVATPYSYGDVSHDSPTTTAPPVTTSPSSGGQTIINNNVDLTETHSILGGISNFLQSIWESIRAIPQSILNGIQGIFVPSDEFIADFEDEIDSVKDRFSWAEDIKEVGAHLADITENRESITAPVVAIPRIVNSKDNTVYTDSGETVLDLSEFTTEILVVRTILSVLLWLFFLWRLYCRLPDIIHGAGAIVGDGSKIMTELDERESQALYNDFDNHDIDKLR